MHACEHEVLFDASTPVAPEPQTVLGLVAQTLHVRPDRVVEVLCKSLVMLACERLTADANAWIDRCFDEARS